MATAPMMKRDRSVASPEQADQLAALWRAVTAAEEVERTLPDRARRDRIKRAQAATAKAQRALAAYAAKLPGVTALSLRRRYGFHGRRVLTSQAFIVDRPGKPKEFVVLKPLPDPEEWLRCRNTFFTQLAQHLVAGVYSDIESLAEELRSWHDNMPENLQSGDKGTAVDEAASQLEEVAQEDHDFDEDLIGRMPVVHIPGEESSRPDRCANCISGLEAVASAARDVMEHMAADPLPEWVGRSKALDDASLREAVHQALKDLVEHLDEAVSTLESVEFPGMF
jgi:hypothetical protein